MLLLFHVLTALLIEQTWLFSGYFIKYRIIVCSKFFTIRETIKLLISLKLRIEGYIYKTHIRKLTNRFLSHSNTFNTLPWKSSTLELYTRILTHTRWPRARVYLWVYTFPAAVCTAPRIFDLSRIKNNLIELFIIHDPPRASSLSACSPGHRALKSFRSRLAEAIFLYATHCCCCI